MKRMKFFKALILTLSLACASSFLYASAMEKTVNVQKTEKRQQDDIYDYTDDVIDPKYVVVKGYNRYQYKLGDELLYTKNNKVGKYKNVKTKEVFDKLPAAENKYTIKRNRKTNKIFYFLNKKPAYELQEYKNILNNYITYSDVNDNKRKFYNNKGTKEYYKIDNEGRKLQYFYLPEPEGAEYLKPENVEYLPEDFDSDAIDPQYEVVKGDNHYQYKLGDELLYTRNNKVGKYKNVKTKKVFDKLPAVENRYTVKRNKNTGKIFYFLNEKPAYELQEYKNILNNYITYSDVNNSNRKFYNNKGEKVYYIVGAPKKYKYDYLPNPIYNNNFAYPRYPSSQYYDLCKKSMFFKPITEEAFDKKYNEEYNNYNYMDLEDMVIINNVRNNLSKKNGEDFRFEFVIEPKAEEELENLNKLNNQGPYDFAKLERISKNITENIRSSFSDWQGKRVELSKSVDPQYKTIKLGDICFYCYDGKIKFYRNLVNGRYYDLDGTEQNIGLPRADMNSTYRVISLPYAPDVVKYIVGKENSNNLKIFDITNEDGKIWYSLGRDKKFYSVQGKCEYSDLHRKANLKLKDKRKLLNLIPVGAILPEKFFDKTKDVGEYAEDPQYEVVNSNGETIYFFEGLPRYIKLEKGGYYNINNGKIYSKLPIVNSDFYWDKEYEVIKRDNKLYYYVNGLQEYEIEEENRGNYILLKYLIPQRPNKDIDDLLLTSIKGKRDYSLYIAKLKRIYNNNDTDGESHTFKKLPLRGNITKDLFAEEEM